MSKPEEMWARHAYDPIIKINHVTNNMTESFNQWVGELRANQLLPCYMESGSRLWED